jgi:prepilin-type N-terminal cleavage/methylation domain-containing protein
VKQGAPRSKRLTYHGNGGFTLIELMFVVIILATLSTVAIFSYKGYIRRARMEESVAFLGAIRIRQEAYFQTYSQYIDTGTNSGDFFPTEIWPGGCSEPSASWNINCPADAATFPGWCALGVNPIDQGEVFFQYLSVGWAPGDSIAPCAAGSTCMVSNPNRPWWVAIAQGDQLCDDTGAKSLAIISSQQRDALIFDVGEGSSADDWDVLGAEQDLSGGF